MTQSWHSINTPLWLQDVIKDAVFHELRKHIHSALQEKHQNFDTFGAYLKTNSRDAIDSNDSQLVGNRESEQVDSCEVEPMEIVDS